MINTLLKKINNPKEFFLELHNIWREEYRKDEKSLPNILITLNKNHGVDFCQLAVDAMNDDFRSFDVTDVLEASLSDLNLNICSVLRFTERLFEGMQGDMMAHDMVKPFEELIVKQPVFARNLISEFLKQDKLYIVGYVSSFYIKLSKNNELTIHNELRALKDHKSLYARMAVVSALGSLNYEPSQNRFLVQQTLNILEEIGDENSDELNRIAIFSYMKLLQYSDQVKVKLIEFSKINNSLIQSSISRVLLTSQEEHGNEDWFSEVLLNLSNVSSAHEGIMDNIDFVLVGLIKKNDNWDLVETFLISWLLNSDYHSKNNKFSKLFNSTIVAYINNHAKFEKLLTTFFNHDSLKIHGAVSEIISYCKVHKINDLTLHKQTIQSLSKEDILYICRKILGFVIAPEYLCSLCFSILDASPRNKYIQELIFSIFSSHIGESYPGRTTNFLKEISSQTKSKNKKRIADQVITDIENHYSQREKLSDLKELSAPRQKSLRINLERNKNMAAALEKAQEGSIVSMIASKITLKQGTGSFHFMNGQYSEISKLGIFSTDMELPNTEITHPVDASIERLNFRLARRGQ